MKTVEYICKKYNIDLDKKSPFEIRCSRWRDLPKLFIELGFNVGAEIGVLRGEWSDNLFKFIPNLKIHCIDKWKFYHTYRDFRSQKHLDRCYEDTKRRLKDKNAIIIKEWSMDAVRDFEDESLDFVFIDGNHSFQYVTNDIAEWSKKVKKGGIVSGHDFFRTGLRGTCIHVKDVVQAWAYSYKIHPWFVLRGDKYSSWMWVKE